MMRALLAVDRLPSATESVHVLRRLALPPRSMIHCLHVAELPHVPGWLPVHAQQHLTALREQTRKDAERLAARVAARLKDRHLRVVSSARTGFPSPEILEAIDQLKIELAVLGTRQLSGFQRFLLGSVTEQILNYAPCSVLVARRSRRRTDGRGLHIVVAVDDSPHANAAIRFLRRLRLPPSSRITLLHAVEKPQTLRQRLFVGGRRDLQTLLEDVARMTEVRGAKLLQSRQRRLGRRGWSVDQRLLKGNPAEEITRTAQHLRADLIVIGSRGMVGMRRILLGSVSRTVVRQASCSVLIVRTRSET